MSDKKDLLNNLKIDRNAPPSEEPMTPLSRYGILGAISVAIVIGWLFFTGEEPVEVVQCNLAPNKPPNNPLNS